LNDSDWTIRFYAASILGEIDDPNTAELLIDALKDDIWEVRTQAAFSLVNSKNVRDVRIIDLITTALIEDPQGDNLLQMRQTARLLGAIGDERAIAPLQRCLDEKYDHRRYTDWPWAGEVKTKCSDALKKIRQRLNK
jgi:HEAT repeat protein